MNDSGFLDACMQGNINLIDAAMKKGVKKFVLVTSIGTGDSKDAPPAQVYDVLKPVLLEKEKAEEHLKVTPGASFPLGISSKCKLYPAHALIGRREKAERH